MAGWLSLHTNNRRSPALLTEPPDLVGDRGVPARWGSPCLGGPGAQDSCSAGTPVTDHVLAEGAPVRVHDAPGEERHR